jgi:hypothetical protein
MKVIDFDEFIQLPEGTIFSYFEKGNCSGFFLKGESLAHRGDLNDYCETSLVPDCWNGDPPTLGDSSRWGCFDYDQMYAIYEEEDIQWLNAVTSPEGCSSADARKLREFNHNLAEENHKLRKALEVYEPKDK